MTKVLDILHQKMGMLRGTFTLRHGDVFEIAASHGLSENEQKRGRYKLGEGITGIVAESGVPQLVIPVSEILPVHEPGRRILPFFAYRFTSWRK